PPLRAPLSRASTFVFKNLTAGPASYLLDIHSRDFVFAPYRVDISADGRVAGVWETYRGNAWETKGAEKAVSPEEGQGGGESSVLVEAKVLSKRGFYEERPKCESSFLPPPSVCLYLVCRLSQSPGQTRLLPYVHGRHLEHQHRANLQIDILH